MDYATSDSKVKYVPGAMKLLKENRALEELMEIIKRARVPVHPLKEMNQGRSVLSELEKGEE